MTFKVIKTRHSAKSRLLGTKWACNPGEPFEIRDGVNHESRSKISMTDLYRLYWISNHGTRVSVKCEKADLPELEDWLKERDIPFYQSRYETPLTEREFLQELQVRADTNNGKGMTEEDHKLVRELSDALEPLTLRFLYDISTPTYHFFFWEPKDAVMFKLTWG